MDISVGIDLGTTNSVCGTLIHGKIQYLSFRGKHNLPSVLLYKDGKLTVGEKARKKSIIYSKNLIRSPKTFLGDYEKSWKIEDREFTPVNVAEEILSSINKEDQEQFQTDEQITAVFDTLGKHWDGLDCIVHSVAYAPREALEGTFVDSVTREWLPDQCGSDPWTRY